MAVLFYFQFRSLNDIETDVGGGAAAVEQRDRRFADSGRIEDYMKRRTSACCCAFSSGRPSRSICPSSSRS
jgi:hypothetical protein